MSLIHKRQREEDVISMRDCIREFVEENDSTRQEFEPLLHSLTEVLRLRQALKSIADDPDDSDASAQVERLRKLAADALRPD